MLKKELTNQERRIAAAILLTGESTTELAERFGTSERTIKYHCNNLLTKLGVSTRIELLAAVFLETVRLSGGGDWPRGSNQKLTKALGTLHLLSGRKKGIAQKIFGGYAALKSGDLKSKKKKGSNKKHAPKGPYDWSKVDWSMKKSEIAKQLGCSKAMVYRKAAALENRKDF